MNRTYRVWYLLVLLVALAPAGARLLMWQRVRSQVIDPDMAQAGEVLFNHEWQDKYDPLSPEGDGLGPVFNANSCVACHNQVRAGGAGGLEHNVTTFTVRRENQTPREGVVHAFSIPGVEPETLKDVDPRFPALSRPTLEELATLSSQSNHCNPTFTGVHLSQRNTPALFGSKLIDEIPERVIIEGANLQQTKSGLASSKDERATAGRALVLANGKIGRFGWKAQMASLSDFVQAACANELGLGNPGQSQPTPIYYSPASATKSTVLDLTLRQCDELTAFCAALPRPVERLPESTTPAMADAGKNLFKSIGCATCHTPNLGNVEGIYSDLLLHSMGQELVGGGSYGEPPIPPPGGSGGGEGPSPSEWRTPPLWGVADSAPYLHDGRAPTLEQAITMHGGQGKRSAAKFTALKPEERERVIDFLKTLRAPAP